MLAAPSLLLNALLENYFCQQTFSREPHELYEPVRYIMTGEGKRIRPLLTLMSCEMLGGNAEEALPVAYALELFHNFTLVHDDIMDNAVLRRGKPSVHKRYGVSNALLSGDVMLLWVYEYLSRVGSEKFYDLLQVLHDKLLMVFEGQQMDLNFEKRSYVSEEEYLQMIEYKTAALIGASMLAGAYLAGASSKQYQLVYQSGISLGLLFQIKDDYLDAYGDPALTGKRIGGDILQNKKTYLWVTAMQQANPDQRKKILALQDEPDEFTKVQSMLQLYDQTGVKERAQQTMHRLFNGFVDALNNIHVLSEKKQSLYQFAKQIYCRNY